MRTAVVGHVEWVDFIRVERVPMRGEIVYAHEAWQEPGGGGAVAAAQLAKLAPVIFFTALGNDDLGRRTRAELTRLGMRVEAAQRTAPQRRAVTYLDAGGERTITVAGEALEPRGDDGLTWDVLDETDAVYVASADVVALRHARRARVLVATSRMLPRLAEAKLEIDAVVGSASDPAERYRAGDLDPPPRMIVRTAGAAGGTFQVEGRAMKAYAPSTIPGPVVDSYGCGDSFAAGLAYALGSGDPPEDAIRFAAACGAAVLTGRGPYEGQLRSRFGGRPSR